jgi:hypothetical protein
MNIFNNLDLVYEICLKLNYFERISFSYICKNYNYIVNQINKKWNIENDLIKQYNMTILSYIYVLKLPFVDNYYHKIKNYYKYNCHIIFSHNGTIRLTLSGKRDDKLFYHVFNKLYNQLYKDGFLKTTVKQFQYWIIRKCQMKLILNQNDKDQLIQLHPWFSDDTIYIKFNPKQHLLNGIEYKMKPNNLISFKYENFDNFFTTFKILMNDIHHN